MKEHIKINIRNIIENRPPPPWLSWTWPPWGEIGPTSLASLDLAHLPGFPGLGLGRRSGRSLRGPEQVCSRHRAWGEPGVGEGLGRPGASLNEAWGRPGGGLEKARGSLGETQGEAREP